MRKIYGTLLLIFAGGAALFAQEPECSGCDAGKLMLQCDYYVVKKEDLSKTDFCRKYADAVDNDGAHAKASWYYLLGGKPEEALRSALEAIDEGQIYAAQYAAEASLIFDEFKAAKMYMKMLREKRVDLPSLKKDLELLKKIYPDTNFDPLMQNR